MVYHQIYYIGNSSNSTLGMAHMFFHLLHVPACACVRIHARQRIIATDNDVGASSPSSILHVSFFIVHLLTYVCIYIVCQIFDAVMYRPA